MGLIRKVAVPAALLFGAVNSVVSQEPCLSIDFTIWEPVDNYAVCSGQGVCSQNETCICDEAAGWTGRSDFLNTEGLDCQINDYAIRVLWGLNAIQAIYSGYKSAPFVRDRYASFKDRQERMKKAGRKESLRNSRGLMASLVLIFVGFPLMVITGLLRIIAAEERVGVTPGLTIMFFLVKLAFYLGNWLYTPALLTSLLRGTKYRKDRLAQLIKVNETFSTLVFILSVLFGATPLVALIVPGERGLAEQVTYIVYFSGMMVTMTIYFSLFTFMKFNVVSVLNESIKVTNNKDTIELRDRMKQMSTSSQIQAGLQLVIYGLFLFWPVLWNKHDYFLPVSWFAFNKLGRECCQTTIRKAKSSKSKRDLGSSSKLTSHQVSEDEDGTFEVTNRELTPNLNISFRPGANLDDDEKVSQSEEYI